MKKNIEVSLLKDSEIDEVITFFNEITKGERDRSKFNWEFNEAPAGKAIYVIAKDLENQKIIGTQCAIPINLISENGNTILTAKSEDSIVHPNYRGMNIFDNMYQLLFEKCKENQIKYLWGFTSAKKPFLKLGFDIQFDHSQSLMVFDVISSYKYLSKLNSDNSAITKAKIFILNFLARVYRFKNIFISLNEIKDKFSFKIIEHFDNNNIVNPNYSGFGIKQDMEYLNWRIFNNPYHKKIFNVCFFNENNESIANLIFNHHKDGVWYLITDVYSNQISEIHKAKILKKAVRLLKSKEKSNLKLIRTWDFKHNEYGSNELISRKKNGFYHLDKGISFVWKSLDEKNELEMNRFNLSRIATQGVI